MKLHNNINKLPFNLFLDIVDTKDLNLLIIDGEFTPEQLQEAWDKINSDYADVINGAKDSVEMAEAKELMSGSNKLNRAKVLIDVIDRIGPNEKLIEELYSFGYSLPENNPKNLKAIVKIFIANHKRDYVALQDMKNQIPETTETEERVIDASYYLETIAVMMAGLKCSIDINTLTLGLYAALIKQYKQFCASLLKTQANAN